LNISCSELSLSLAHSTMQSLRTRRASTKPAKSQPPKLKKSPSQAGARDARATSRKSRVDDKIKKRMSMRYADISAPNIMDIPSVPSLPSTVRLGGENEQDEFVRDNRNSAVVDSRAADKAILEQEDFDPDACE
jgi:exocyst complex component 8